MKVQNQHSETPETPTCIKPVLAVAFLFINFYFSVMISDKQKMILEFCSKNNNQISKTQAVQLIGNCYFLNAPKYVGEVLSRMVKFQLLKRVKNGFFEVQNKQTVTNIINPNQLQLL